MATLSQYQEWVKRYLAEDATDTSNLMYPDDEITAALNAAQNEWIRRLSRHCDFFRKTTTVNATTTAVTMAADFLCNLQVRFGATENDRKYVPATTKSALDEMNPNWRDEESTTPLKYYLNLNSDGTTTLQFYPALSAEVTNGLFYSYTAKATDMSLAADTAKCMTWFPELDPLALPAYALTLLLNYEAGTKDDQVAKWDRIFEAQIERARGILKYQNQHYPSYKRGR